MFDYLILINQPNLQRRSWLIAPRKKTQRLQGHLKMMYLENLHHRLRARVKARARARTPRQRRVISRPILLHCRPMLRTLLVCHRHRHPLPLQMRLLLQSLSRLPSLSLHRALLSRLSLRLLTSTITAMSPTMTMAASISIFAWKTWTLATIIAVTILTSPAHRRATLLRALSRPPQLLLPQ
jgi:hypothetical protein